MVMIITGADATLRSELLTFGNFETRIWNCSSDYERSDVGKPPLEQSSNNNRHFMGFLIVLAKINCGWHMRKQTRREGREWGRRRYFRIQQGSCEAKANIRNLQYILLLLTMRKNRNNIGVYLNDYSITWLWTFLPKGKEDTRGQNFNK